MTAQSKSIGPHDLAAVAAGLSGRGRGKALAGFNGCTLGLAKFARHPLWERHPASDELLQVIDGELDLTILSPEGPIEMRLRPGLIFVVPRGLWHSPRPRGSVSLLFLSNDEGSEVCDETVPQGFKASGVQRKRGGA